MTDTLMDQRRRNLKLLAAQWDGPTGLARKLGLAGPSYISQLTGGQRPFTEKTARKIEQQVKLPVGWMDADHKESVRPARVDEQLVRQVVVTVGAVLNELGLQVSHDVFADLVELVHEDAARRGSVDEQFVQRVAKLVRR